ncbi:MAG: DUF4426 domain-containing protein [Pseudomonadales bacterium]|jgi:hypothetical protein
MQNPKRYILSLLVWICLVPSISAAETIQWQGFDIHYTTFSSMLIPPEVAASHNIARANNRIVTNISILKNGEPQTATITGRNSNLLNQLYTMQFTEVVESSAVYYLANQLIDERDTLRFEIQISPSAIDDTYTLEFMRTY